MSHLPEVDFKVILRQCFAGFKGQVGAACVRAMAMCALSYNTHGRRVQYWLHLMFLAHNVGISVCTLMRHPFHLLRVCMFLD